MRRGKVRIPERVTTSKACSSAIPSGVKTRVLVVEDEEAISEPLAEHLAREGFAPEVASSIGRANEAFEREAPDVILLDVMLPDGDGRDFCREIRKRSDVPILMLTARGEEIDRVLGLELGADDYIVKPFSARELVARVRAVMRRGRAPDPGVAITIGTVSLDPSRADLRQGRGAHRADRERVRPAALPDGTPGRRGQTRADHGRGLGPALVRTDEDARRAHLVAAEEAGERSWQPSVYHHDPRGRLPLRCACGRHTLERR